MNRFYYKKIEDNWETILRLYTVDNWSTHKIARVLFRNEKEYFWRIYRRLQKENVKKSINDKMSFIRQYKNMVESS